MPLRRRPRPGQPTVLAEPTRLTAESTVRCRIDPERAWWLLEDPSSPLHHHDDVVHAARLDGTGTGVGAVQVTLHHDPATGHRFVSALEVTELVPGRYAAWRRLPTQVELPMVPSGSSVRVQPWPDGSVTITHGHWVELPAGYPRDAVAGVQADIDAAMDAMAARCEDVVSRC